MSDIRDNLSTMESKEDSAQTMQAMHSSGNMSRQQLLNQINEVSFAINDMQLYLDTHPNCREGLRFMERHQEKRQRLLDIYARNYGPLTMDSMVMSDEDSWKWMQQPFPWQQEGGCR